jgi:hypothetical protein
MKQSLIVCAVLFLAVGFGQVAPGKNAEGISLRKKEHITFDSVFFRGIVMDKETHEQVPFVNVREEKTRNETFANENGKFLFGCGLSDLADTFAVVFEFPGYVKKKIVFNKKDVESEYQVVLGVELDARKEVYGCCMCCWSSSTYREPYAWNDASLIKIKKE